VVRFEGCTEAMSVFDNNRELLDRFRRGERAALAEVYDRYVDDVAILARRGFTMEAHGHVYVPGVNVEGEHELVQDTFVKAFSETARSSFDGLRPYRPFLLRITKNLMIDRFRARRKEATHDGSGVGDIDAILETNAGFVIAPDHEEDLHWRTLSTATAEFVARLDAESRDVVRLRFEDDLSQDAVAERLGCSRRRVRTLEQRISTQLIKYLKRLRKIDS
jgi:RNA polymerase sigma factor (sigma-70 family)